MAEQWKKGDAVWGPIVGRGWMAGEVIESDPYYPIVGFMMNRGCVGRNLRPRDPAQKGNDKPTADSEARRG